MTACNAIQTPRRYTPYFVAKTRRVESLFKNSLLERETERGYPDLVLSTIDRKCRHMAVYKSPIASKRMRC